MLRHLAVIMDGNGRWAECRGRPRTFGHLKGAKVAQRLIEQAVRLEIPLLTLFAFSTENWKRPRAEVQAIMLLLERYVRRSESYFHEHQVKFEAIGDLSRLPAKTRLALAGLKERTRSYTGTKIIIAINYSGRQDILQAVSRGDLQSELQAPDVDLVIRTGGERRLSNFLLWQAAYAEIHFSTKLWPDFSEADLLTHIDEFTKTERRFGAVGDGRLRGLA